MSNQRPSFAKRDREMRLKDKARAKSERRAAKRAGKDAPQDAPASGEGAEGAIAIDDALAPVTPLVPISLPR
jgi:hypothetical protein